MKLCINPIYHEVILNNLLIQKCKLVSEVKLNYILANIFRPKLERSTNLKWRATSTLSGTEA